MLSLSLAEIPLTCELRFPETASYFKKFLSEVPSQDSPVSVPDKLVETYLHECSSVAFAAADEYHLLHLVVSNALLPYRRCLFHGTAFLWQGRAWLFSAPSGTGKTTQFRRWRSLYRDEVSILNGDKPILEFTDCGQIMVHPSPWKGKERWGGMQKAPLGGIIYLEQGKENKITRMKPQEAVIPIYKQFLFLPETGDAIHAVCQLEDALLRNIPVWKLVNLGDAASARLTHDVLLKYLER